MITVGTLVITASASATQATSFIYRHVPRHHSRPSDRLRKAQPLNHPKHREAFFKRVPFSIQSFNAGYSRRHPPHTSRTRSGHITHLQQCAATHEKSAPRELHPTGHARRIHSLQTVCINRSLPAASRSRPHASRLFRRKSRSAQSRSVTSPCKKP